MRNFQYEGSLEFSPAFRSICLDGTDYLPYAIPGDCVGGGIVTEFKQCWEEGLSEGAKLRQSIRYKERTRPESPWYFYGSDEDDWEEDTRDVDLEEEWVFSQGRKGGRHMKQGGRRVVFD
jgi:hypothetical protein